MLKAGRGVAPDYRSRINDPSQGEKGFTDKCLVSQVLDQFNGKTGRDLSRPHGTLQGGIPAAMLESQREVVLEEPIINKQGIGLKGFVP